jgi:CBS domain-containing protein
LKFHRRYRRLAFDSGATRHTHAIERAFARNPRRQTDGTAEGTMKALDVMVRNVITVKADDQVAEAVKLLAEHDISALPVVDDGNNVVGIISEADLLRRLV